ncbi:MAG: HK97 family phage prohead protease [Pseudomonadota bacterium]
MPEKEIRSFPIELRKDGEGVKLAGMPIVYGKWSEDMGGFIEVIDAGAATKALKKSDIRALYGHNSDTLLPLGRQSAKTLRAKESSEGVDIEIDPPKRNPFVDALIESIERGDIREMSFGFNVSKDEWTYPKNDKEPAIRHIIEFEQIYDVSYVIFAAYNDTTVALRSLEENRKGAAVPPGGNGGTNDPAIITGLRRKKLELKTKHF